MTTPAGKLPKLPTSKSITVKTTVTPAAGDRRAMDQANAAQKALFSREPDGQYEITMAASNDGTRKARVQIYGVIGDWWDGLDAATLATQLHELEADEIEVHLNSPGGIAFDGIAIYNALRQHDADVHIVVDGYAASAASIIAMAGDKVTMSLGSQLMIHNASGLCWGNAEDMRQVADMLDKLGQSAAEIYADHAGGDTVEWRAAMDAETWYTASEAVAAGLADTVGTTKKDDDAAKKATAAFDLSIFAYAGRDAAPKPAIPEPRAQIPPAPPAVNPQPEGGRLMPTISTEGISKRLGVSADSEETVILAALDEALAERADPSPNIPEGTTLIDKEQLADLQSQAKLGAEAREQQLADQREAAVQNAIRTGRIAPARADAWRASLKADPGSAAVLDSLEPNTMVPLTQVGYGEDHPDGTDVDTVRNTTEYKNWSM